MKLNRELFLQEEGNCVFLRNVGSVRVSTYESTRRRNPQEHPGHIPKLFEALRWKRLHRLLCIVSTPVLS
jgi:hypothetical protein